MEITIDLTSSESINSAASELEAILDIPCDEIPLDLINNIPAIANLIETLVWFRQALENQEQ